MRKKNCSNRFIRIWMREKWNFHHISIVIKKLLMKWAPGQQQMGQVTKCGCLVTWFCYQLIAKPGNKTATVSWSDPDTFSCGIGRLEQNNHILPTTFKNIFFLLCNLIQINRSLFGRKLGLLWFSHCWANDDWVHGCINVPWPTRPPCVDSLRPSDAYMCQ